MLFDIAMRAAPTSSFNDLLVGDRTTGSGAVTSVSNASGTNINMLLSVGHAAYGAGLRPAQLFTATTAGYIAFDAEL